MPFHSSLGRGFLSILIRKCLLVGVMGKRDEGGRQHSRVPRQGAEGLCHRGNMGRCEGTQPHGHSLMGPLGLAEAGPISGGDLVHRMAPTAHSVPLRATDHTTGGLLGSVLCRRPVLICPICCFLHARHLTAINSLTV